MLVSTIHSPPDPPAPATGYHLVVHLAVKSSGIRRAGNHSDAHALLLAMLLDSNPGLSMKLHEPRARKPWSFSPVFFDRESPVPGSKWFHVREGTGGRFFVNTTSSDVYAAVMEASMSRRRYRVNDIAIELGDIECDDVDLRGVPPARESEVTFRSTTFFREHSDAERTETLDAKMLIRFQCDAMEKAGMVTVDRDRLAKHVTISRQNTRASTGIVNKDGIELAIHGFAGVAVLRCTSPDPGAVKDFALVMASLPYFGAGSRTSMGFGHCSVRLAREG
jgi:CRISPR-associated endoribonuclease Cas6